MASLIIFVLSYAGFVFFPKYKTWIACIGAFALIALGELSPLTAFKEVHWNVMGLFVGTLILAELFLYSRMPAVLAEWLVDRSKTARLALVSVLGLTSVISMFVENVAVVLLVAPVALALCEKLNISPVKPLIFLAMVSNLQGTATLIGDPPSMILGAYMKMNFMDFFFYHGKPSLFFIVQVGALSTLLFILFVFRHYSQPISLLSIETVRSWVPTILLGALILILALGSGIDPDSQWLAGTVAMVLGIIGLIWNHFGPRWQSALALIRALDWKTTFFLMALFILVAAVRIEGWMDALASWIVNALPANQLLVFIFLIGFSCLVSAFVDNVPYLLAMIPVVQEVADGMQMPLPLLIFGMAVGTCLGGNITPIGASANIVAVSFLERHHHPVTFRTYVPLGFLFTMIAVIPAAIALWLIWS